ncbi:nitrogen permease regulator 2, partial [Rhodotorula sp. JG-1b]
QYTPKLVAVFYAVFDPTLGPRVVHQIPEGSVATALSTFPSRTPTPAALDAATPATTTTEAAPTRANPVLFDFSSILDFVIPKPELCGHLITKATRTSKILGFPQRIVDEEKYHGSKSVYNRNAFIFNVCFVFDRDAELSVYEPVVRKTGRSLSALEEHSSLLSSPPPGFSMANLLEQLYLDLNAYFETSIPLLGVDLDVGLFPFYMNPPEVRTWQVPVAVTNLEQMKTRSWDVTLYKVCSFIDGVNHVKRIAELAEVDLYLARQCIQHLVYYNAVITTDIFQFSNSYALLPDIADAVQYAEEEDGGATDLPTECENYVFSGERDTALVPFATLLSYYSQLRPGYSLAEWIEALSLDSQPIDIRRMIQFGVIKGFLRRVYAYPIWLDHPNLQQQQTLATQQRGGTDNDDNWGEDSTTTTMLLPSVSYPPSLAMMFDGTHHTDEICLKYSCSWRTLELVLRQLG